MPDRIAEQICHGREGITKRRSQLCRELWEYLWCHLHREFLEHTHRALRKPVAEMNQPQIHSAQAPVGQDLNQPTIA
jgi:hypothetical protein